MRAMVTPKFGGSELFEERDDVERPPPGPGQVMVRVLATADTDNQQSLKALGVDIAKTTRGTTSWRRPSRTLRA